MHQVPTVHGVQHLEVGVKAEGLDVELEGTHGVLHTKCCQHFWMDDAKDANLHLISSSRQPVVMGCAEDQKHAHHVGCGGGKTYSSAYAKSVTKNCLKQQYHTMPMSQQ